MVQCSTSIRRPDMQEEIIDNLIEDAMKHSLIAGFLHPAQVKKIIAEVMKETHCQMPERTKKQLSAEVIELISDKLIYPLLDEYDVGLWEHISHIELAEEWIKILNDNPYPKVENYTEARKRDLRNWITNCVEQLKEPKMSEFNFDTRHYFSSLNNLNRECKNYTDSEIKYKELITKYENEIYNNALNDVLIMTIRKHDKALSFEELLSLINTLQKGVKQ